MPFARVDLSDVKKIMVCYEKHLPPFMSPVPRGGLQTSFWNILIQATDLQIGSLSRDRLNL